MDAKDPPPSTAASTFFDPDQLHLHHHHHPQHVYPMQPAPAPWPSAPPPPQIDAYPYNPQQINPNYPSHLPPQPYPTPAPSNSPSVSLPSRTLPYVADTNPHPEPAPPPPEVVEPTRPDAGKNSVSKLRKPRKTNNGPGGRSTLFWVHTDPQSVSEGTREETLKRIRSHVMSEHNRKKRMENTKRYNKGKTWKHLAFQPVETAASSAAAPTTSTTAPSHRSPSKTASPKSRISSDSSPSSSPEEVKRESPQQAIAAVSDTEVVAYPASVTTADGYGGSPPFQPYVVETAQSMSPYAYLGPGGKDPFSVMHTPLTDRMMRHLQHCKHRFSLWYLATLTMFI